MNKRDVSRLIRERRQNTGLTQVELATQSGVSLPLIQIIEAGRGNPTFEVLAKIARALNMSLSIEPEPADWGYLVHFGLPLLPAKGSATKESWDWQKFVVAVRSGVAEIQSAPQKEERRRDAMIGLLLALKEHYPQLATAAGLKPFFRLAKSPSGRHIKLKRLALATLQEYL